MGAPKASEEDILRWSDIIEEGESSGMSARAFCEKRGINTKTYSAWKKRLSHPSKPAVERKSKSTSPLKPAKSAVSTTSSSKSEKSPLKSSASPAFSIEVELPNGVGLSISCATSADFDTALDKLSKIKL